MMLKWMHYDQKGAPHVLTTRLTSSHLSKANTTFGKHIRIIMVPKGQVNVVRVYMIHGCIVFSSSFTADMWSVGCVMAELLTGKELFKADDCIRTKI